MPDLFSPITIGSIQAKNRVFMAPLTRGRATKEAIPTDLMVTYYAQRASAGLIISEATGINRAGLGWPFAPGIYSPEQVEKWKPVTKAVHEKGGKIICQLWHMGRVVHSSVTGSQPVSASATLHAQERHTYEGKKPAEVAHELTVPEIKETVTDFAKGAKNAITAGFDGVQLHAANGYLIDQFLKDSTNKRTDEYGGSVENRLRFLDEAVTAVIDAVGAEKVSVRLSPNDESMGVSDSNPEPLFTAAAELLDRKKVAMIELREPGPSTTLPTTNIQPQLHDAIRKAYSGVLVLNQDYDREVGDKAIAEGIADAISFGRGFISNPTLPSKLKDGVPLTPVSFGRGAGKQGPEGYTDYE